MTSAADTARARWGIGQGVPIVYAGTGDGALFDDARSTARGLMPQLVSLDGIVRKTTLAELDSLLTSFGLKEIDDQPYNPPGRQLFYSRGRLLIRIKTRGNPPNASYRANQPHLSVSLMKDGEDTSFAAEMVKFSPEGKAQPKSTGKGTLFLPVTGTAGNVRFRGDAEAWAKSTHFNFPPSIMEVI
jgi:hypothetical protein